MDPDSSADAPQVDNEFAESMGFVTTYLRAVESSRDDHIIYDPFAEPLTKKYNLNVQKSMRGLSSRSQLHSRPEDFIAFRTRYLDEALDHRKAEIHQIVVLGAGMDARAYRLESLRGCHVFEVDQAEEVFHHKREVFTELKAQMIADKVEYIVSDLAENGMEESLIEHGFDSRLPTFWAMEGLLPYIELSGIVELLKAVDRLSAAGSELWVDMPGQCVSDTDEWGKRAMKYGEDNPLEGVLSGIPWELEVQGSLRAAGEHFGRHWVPMLSPKTKQEVPFFYVIGKKPKLTEQIHG